MSTQTTAKPQAGRSPSTYEPRKAAQSVPRSGGSESKTVRRVKALRRVSLAVDRVIRGENPEQARRWVNAWASLAGLRP